MAPNTMEAIHLPTAFNPHPSTLIPISIPVPSPGPDQVLVRVTHCSPQHADILHARGTHQNNHRSKGWCHPPFTLGYNFAGIVHQTPSSDRGFKEGDRVFGMCIGAFAEWVCAPVANVRRVPEGVALEVACAAGGGAVSYGAVVDLAKVREGETVLVTGASGGLGGMCCAVAKAVGARVVALVGSQAKGKLVQEELGVKVVIDDGAGEWVREVMRWTGEKGVNAMFDNVGLVGQGLDCLAFGGRIVVLGFAGRKGVMENVGTDRVLHKGATLLGYRFGESGRQDAEGLEEIWRGYLEMLGKGLVKVVLFGEYRGLKAIGRAFADLEERKVVGKIVIKVNSVGEGIESKL